jgi:hypothetical protein
MRASELFLVEVDVDGFFQLFAIPAVTFKELLVILPFFVPVGE